LADNAVKYGERADISLQEKDGKIIVTIEDDGPGIPENERVRVFDPFYRVDPSRNLDTGGVGLGLAVTRSVIRAHGGEVSFKTGKARFCLVVELPKA
jgi:signal transduction histidine kinase